jgi:DNA-binding transcriptional regulator LsrR (DeoR family)
LWDRRTRQGTPVLERVISEVTVIDPHHALFGRPLQLISLSAARGRDLLTVALPDGRQRTLRRSITDLDEQYQAGGSLVELPWVSVRTLIPLARHLKTRFTLANAEVIRDAPSSSRANKRRAAGRAVASCSTGCSSRLVGTAETGATTTGSADGSTPLAHETAAGLPTEGRS